jgi:hypothetical protein
MRVARTLALGTLLFAACTNGGDPGRSPGAATIAFNTAGGDSYSWFERVIGRTNCRDVALEVNGVPSDGVLRDARVGDGQWGLGSEHHLFRGRGRSCPSGRHDARAPGLDRHCSRVRADPGPVGQRRSQGRGSPSSVSEGHERRRPVAVACARPARSMRSPTSMKSIRPGGRSGRSGTWWTRRTGSACTCSSTSFPTTCPRTVLTFSMRSNAAPSRVLEVLRSQGRRGDALLRLEPPPEPQLRQPRGLAHDHGGIPTGCGTSASTGSAWTSHGASKAVAPISGRAGAER